MDKTTGQALVDANGNYYMSYLTVTIDENNKSGVVEMHFDDIDVSKLGYHDIVVFERIYMADSKEEINDTNLINDHSDINDIDQTIQVIKEPVESVFTGNSNNLLGWLAMAFLAMISMIGVVVGIVREKKGKLIEIDKLDK